MADGERAAMAPASSGITAVRDGGDDFGAFRGALLLLDRDARARRERVDLRGSAGGHLEVGLPGERNAHEDAVGLGALVTELHREQNWSGRLSIGEQQRLAFARALLYAPHWLYMDEATSAMDEEDEAALYQALIHQLPGLSIVSVGHRSSLKRFHSRHVRIEGGHLVEQAVTA